MSTSQYYRLKNAGVLNHKVVTVEPYGFADVYNMEVEDTHNFAAGGVIVHNCDATRYGASGFPRGFDSKPVVEHKKSIFELDMERAMRGKITNDPIYGSYAVAD